MARAVALLLLAAAVYGEIQPMRWAFFSRSLTSDSHVAEFRAVAETAAAHGLNGILLSTSFDSMDRQNEQWYARLQQVRQIAANLKLELIPQFYSIGYAGGLLAHNRNLAEGLPVRGAVFVAGETTAAPLAEPAVAMVNGGFEEYTNNTARSYAFHDQPGVVSFIDTAIRHSGLASLRCENFTANAYGHGRVMQEIAVAPYRQYRISAWVKTEALAPANALRVQILTTRGQALAPFDAGVPATTDWRKVTFGFNSLGNSAVRFYAGVWGAQSGKFWLDDLAIEEVALLNVLRRDGTPLRVEDEASGEAFREGVDYAPVKDLLLDFNWTHAAPALQLQPGGRIRAGTRLRVSYYHGTSINNGQVSACMSEPEVYGIWRGIAARMQTALQPRRWMLSVDEIRMGGTCDACKRRGLTMGEILGDAITRGVAMVREASPGAEVYAWSDMFDPNHNAHGDYYLVEGDFAGSWDHIPRDLNIVCWYYDKRVASLDFFSSRGFRTLAGAYYDGDDLSNPRGWLEALRTTPGAQGIMYTTWQNKYGLLGAFGDLLTTGTGASGRGGTGIAPRPRRD
jgi:hypothetical protein